TARSRRKRSENTSPAIPAKFPDLSLLLDCSGRPRTFHRALQFCALSLILRFRLLAHSERDEGTVVSPRPFLISRHSLEHSQNALRRVSRCAELSLHQFFPVRLFDFPG